jgi:hypothetical protein
MSAPLSHYVGNLYKNGNPNQNYGTFAADAPSSNAARVDISRQASALMEAEGIAFATLQMTSGNGFGMTVQLENQKHTLRR